MFGGSASASAAPAGGGFSFGGAATAAPAAPAGGGFSFGGAATAAPAAPAGGGFSFGGATTAPTATAPSAGGGFSFGGAAAAPTATAAPSTGGGFSFGGATAAPTATAAPSAGGGFSFGGAAAAAPTATAAPASGGFSFGGATAAPTATTAPSAGGGFSFGGAAAAPTTPAGGGFSFGGATAAPAASAGVFGSSQQSSYNNSNSIAACPGLSKILQLQLAYAPYIDINGQPHSEIPPPQLNAPANVMINRSCEFEAVFYDIIGVDSQNKKVYKQKPSYIHQKRWEKINEMDNPDPEKYEPTFVHGINELKTRFEAQIKKTTDLNSYVTDIRNTVSTVDQSLNQITSRTKELRRNHEKIVLRLLNVMCKIEVLRCRGVSLHPDEVRYREKLEQLLSVLTNQHNRLIQLMNAPHTNARINTSTNLNQTSNINSNTNATYEDVSPDSNDVFMIYQTLKQQRGNLATLTDTIRKDARDMKIIEKHIQQTVQ